MAGNDQYDELADFLRAEGHAQAEVDKILARVRQYEVQVQHDSIMDSIGNGTLDLAALIKEALGESQ